MPLEILAPQNLLDEEIFSDENLLQITGQIVTGQTVLVAYSIGLFTELLSTPLSICELSNALNLNKRAVQALVSCACSMHLIEFESGAYQLTALGRSFFDKESPTYYGGALDLLIQHNEIMNYSTIKDAILSNAPQADGGKDIFAGEDSLGGTEDFVRELHQKASAPALHWVKQIDLSVYKSFVDIAGGSGMHTIAACLKNKDLQGTICERKPVLVHTAGYVKSYGLQSRIRMHELDMWSAPFPEGDVFFMADIFHDWDRERCLILAKKCFDSVSVNGKILLHEMLFDEDKTGPALTAAYNMKMLLWTEGQQYSFEEIKGILEEAGFENVTKKQALGNWSLIIGEKLSQ